MTTSKAASEFISGNVDGVAIAAVLRSLKRQIRALKVSFILVVSLLLFVNIAVVFFVLYCTNNHPHQHLACHTQKTNSLAAANNDEIKTKPINNQTREFFESCYGRNATEVRLLVEEYKIADVNIELDGAKHGAWYGNHAWSDGTACLHFAAVGGKVDTVKMLIEQYRANVNKAEKNGRTPLSMASYHGQFSVVQYLCEKANATLDTKTVEGWTPLMGAVMGKRGEIVKYLLQRGADVNVKSSRGITALDMAENQPEIKDLLIN